MALHVGIVVVACNFLCIYDISLAVIFSKSKILALIILYSVCRANE